MANDKFMSCAARELGEFVAFCRGSDAWNPEYEKLTRRLDRFLRERFPGATALAQEMLDLWFRPQGGESEESAYKRCAPARRLVGYLGQRGQALSVPPTWIRLRKSRPRPYPMTDDEIARFFDCCDHVCDSVPARYAGRLETRLKRITVPVLFRLLYSSGIRPPEARWLKTGEVDLSLGVLDIKRSKGHGQHYVALHPSMADLMSRYDRAVSEMIPAREYFFPNFRGGCIRAMWISTNFRECWSRANGSSRAVAYDFRHHYATENINSWPGDGLGCIGRLVALSKSMGHSSLESTTYYYSLTPRFSGTMEERSGKGLGAMLREEFLDGE